MFAIFIFNLGDLIQYLISESDIFHNKCNIFIIIFLMP